MTEMSTRSSGFRWLLLMSAAIFAVLAAICLGQGQIAQTLGYSLWGVVILLAAWGWTNGPGSRVWDVIEKLFFTLVWGGIIVACIRLGWL